MGYLKGPIIGGSICINRRVRFLDPVQFDGGGYGMGNVYYVMQAANPNYSAFISAYQGNYPDGSAVVHTTIQSALNATVTERNDYVIVMPDNDDYDITAALTMTKRNVHLICPAGIGAEVGSSNAARIHQNTANTEIIILSSLADGCEIAGFWFKAVTTQTTAYNISVPSASTGQCSNIHHNTFNVTVSGATDAGAISFGAGGSGNYSNIHHNRFYFSGNGATGAYGVYMATTQSIFAYNDMHVLNGATLTVGVRCAGVGSIIKYNNFFAHRATTGIAAGAFGAAIILEDNADGTCVIGNRGAVATGTLIQGGTADTTFCDNRSAVDGGLVPVDQNIDT